MAPFDCIIVGGGIVGLATAAALLDFEPNRRVLVVEKESVWAAHQTGRNSGVIHSGIYYKPGSLKARLAHQGNRSMVEFCQSHHLPYEICGKVIVATAPEQLPLLENLYKRGCDNGLQVVRLEAQEVQEIEPHVRCLSGILVPSTGM